MSDIVDMINDEFDDYQKELLVKDKRLKLLVDFSSYDSYDSLINLINEFYDSQ